ncbi:sugar phosphate isomerase/epimerase family protein [Paenibacillus radicis (ex Xue et al. 2023)]|uniref:Sugar phosphate isomerase/epimerase n=1 Tax=Paenibacillus radicis (ex Xue et al. 2023) TaxID=2972489 RepID=A0ABT1YDJ3_9BACL|nr:sugar phosphate isomerase/epimerase family protein [Paenibacillus radicis (ex Xue et al. 2023)]MCR8631252.1 sugar phosphate isomerase/epimerase [Paenibacillus radicis (ex Xue et al. 2023)]
MNKLGFMSYVYMGWSAEDIAENACKHGLKYMQLDPKQKFQIMDDEPFSPIRIEKLRTIFENKGISIIGLSGYTNLLNPNLAKREDKLAQLEKMIDLCSAYGTRYIATETGSLHPTNAWRDYEGNRSPEAWEQLLSIVDRLRNRAVKNGAVLLVEGFALNVLATVDQAACLIEQLGSEGLGIIMDPFNYFTQEDLSKQEEAMAHVFKHIGPYSPIAHAKDSLYNEEGFTTPRVGAGQANWDVYAAYLDSCMPEVPLILEHAKPEEITDCVALIQQAFENAKTGREVKDSYGA